MYTFCVLYSHMRSTHFEVALQCNLHVELWFMCVSSAGYAYLRSCPTPRRVITSDNESLRVGGSLNWEGRLNYYLRKHVCKYSYKWFYLFRVNRASMDKLFCWRRTVVLTLLDSRLLSALTQFILWHDKDETHRKQYVPKYFTATLYKDWKF